MNTHTPISYMHLALQLAEKGRGSVSPNPMVGCVLVKDQQIVGTGFHQRAGEAHAEVYALREAKEKAMGAIAYVTLEPCCHFGKTPPCTNALIEAGIKKIYVACLDPNPFVAGKGIAALQKAGVDVEVGLLEKEAQQLNEIFFHYIKHKRPFVIAKWAMSLNGKTCVHTNDADKKISTHASHKHAHCFRNQVDAILIGARTAIIDNPQLTVRYCDEVNVRQPTRIILTARRVLPSHLKIINDSAVKTIVVVTEKNKRRMNYSNVEFMVLPEDANGNIQLTCLLDELGKREISSLLVEGGMRVHESFFKENLVDKVHVYLSPLFIGSTAKKKLLHITQSLQLDHDFHFLAHCED